MSDSPKKPRSVRDGSPRRPTPVREALPARPAEKGPPSSPVPPPRVVFRVDEETWSAEIVGKARSGTPPDSGAPLLLLRFRPAEEGSGPEREAWAVGRSLFDLSSLQLREHFERSRPARETPKPPPDEPRRKGRRSRGRRR